MPNASPSLDATVAGAYDVVVAGAGPAGSAAASRLVRGGRSVLLLEAATFPRFSVGESLLPMSLTALGDAGLLDAVRARNFQHKPGAVFLRGQERCDFRFDEQWSTGFDHALQVQRADFDATLAAAAQAAGADLRFAARVDAVERDASGTLRVSLAGVGDQEGARAEVAAKFFIDCSGFHRFLAKNADLSLASTQTARTSITTWLRDETGDPCGEQGSTWVSVVGDDAWMWVIPFANGTASVGVVGATARIGAMGADHDATLRRLVTGDRWLQQRFSGYEAVAPTRSLSGFASESKSLVGSGYCIAGNAIGFLDPIFSSGVTLALTSGVSAAVLALRELEGDVVDWSKEYEAPMRAGFDVFRAYVDAWYDGTLGRLFFETRHEDRLKRQICSILAGYVWDSDNPLVLAPRRKLEQLRRTVLATARSAS